jgi:excisionase family DNA binding protein
MATKKDNFMSVTEVSELGEISRQRVLQIIEAGDLQAEKVGNTFIIHKNDFDAWNSSRRDVGRPPKKKTNE